MYTTKNFLYFLEGKHLDYRFLFNKDYYNLNYLNIFLNNMMFLLAHHFFHV